MNMTKLILCLSVIVAAAIIAPAQPISQTSVISGDIDPTGTWLAYQNDGSIVSGTLIYIRKRVDNIDIISDSADGNMSTDRTAFIRNGRLNYSDTMSGSAAIDPTGSRVDWADGTKWIRQVRSLPDTFAVRHSEKWPSPAVVTTKPIATPTPTPRPTPTPTPVQNDIPNLTCTYTIYKADGSIDKGIGTVFYENAVLTFKVTEGRAFRKATSFVTNGIISTGWNTTGTVSNDGKTIFWSDKTKWIRQ